MATPSRIILLSPVPRLSLQGLGKTVQALSLVATLEASSTWLDAGGATGVSDRSGRASAAKKQAAADSEGNHSLAPVSLEHFLKCGTHPPAAEEILIVDEDGDDDGDASSLEADTPADAGRPRSKATLVVCPMSLLSQWGDECHVHLDDFSVLLYYGAERNKDPATLCTDYDVIITTYGVVTSEHIAATRGQAAPLFEIMFCKEPQDCS